MRSTSGPSSVRSVSGRAVSNHGGDGVFFYLANGAQVVIDNGANVNLVAGGNKTSTGATAQSVGSAYDGILFYQAPTANTPDQISIAGGSKVFINGAMYAPSADLIFSNGSGTTIDGGIVAKTLTMQGGAVLNANNDVSQGSVNLTSARRVE